MAHDGLAQTFAALGRLAAENGRSKDARHYFSQAEREFRKAIYWAEVHNQHQAVFYNHLGWFYLDWQRYPDAIKAFEMAMNEDLEFFGSYWGIGRAKLEQGYFEEALNYLRIALDNAPADFQPPASEEIPELILRCENAIATAKL
jgi:tetratricopeptide (TPR) repeat protein